ncbi:PREDICTED: complement factor H-like isoform X2 [Miniopterus natalensis]|uniref:complement factor H-like isoform X2 n=1 Tax=Miniopterus natalensis TaxID=291302 RepID=UPI0007A6DC30|nr:PREDICTED: complement factor H-like isoform X2 [Miniopterus natalensis]
MRKSSIPFSVVKCLPVAEPQNGRLIDSALEPNQEYTFGQVVKIVCNPGFKLDGPPEIHCSANGRWSQERPNCVGISCKVPEIPNGEPTSPKNSYKENERFQYRCFPGYSYSERAEAVCTQFGWTPAPSCKEVTCEPPRIANSHFTPDRTKYRVGHIIRYNCKSGYYPSTRGNTAKCTDIGWEPPPRCSFQPCDFPDIPHGYLHHEARYKPYFPVSVGKWYYYSCHNNYVTPSESSWEYLTCTRDGWSPKVPCLRKCVFNHLENGHSPRYERKYLQGQSLKVNCYQGYSLENQQTIMTCTEDGWVPPPKCIRVDICLKSEANIENGFISESESTYTLHKEIKYNCRQGYITEDGQTSGYITCLQSGWSAQPKCVKKECIVPDIEPNLLAQPQKDKYVVGDVLKFSCRRRLKLLGPDSVQCYHFGWSPNLPTCKAVVQPCGPPPPLPDGETAETPKGHYEHGEVVEYVCNPRFLMKGSRKVQCVDGEWTPPPVCIEENSTCGDIPALDHGNVSHATPPYHHGMSVEFSCGEAFTMIGHRSITCIRGNWTQPPQCIATGELAKCKLPTLTTSERIQLEWVDSEHNRQMNYSCGGKSGQKHSTCVNGTWEPEVSCKEAPRCPPPPQIPKSQTMTTTVNYPEGEKISILCQENFLIQEGEEIVCRNGTWESIPRCVEKAPCPEPPHVEHGHVESPGAAEDGEETPGPQLYAHGTKLNYTCNDGFRLSKEDGITCHLGKWGTSPQCVGLPCGPPPKIPNANMYNVLNSYQYGQKYTYSCLNGFGIQGPASVECEGRKWSPEPECTKATCSQPPSFDNAIFVGPRKTLYRSGDRVTYRCQEYYQMDGLNYVTCKNNRWIGSLTCKDTSCGSPPAVENAFVQNNMPRYSSGDTVRYACKNSLDLFGNPEVSCLNGTWTDPPQCKESRWKCGPPPTIDNGDITTYPLARYAPGSSVEYQCQSYYELQGNRKIECRDGKWSEPPKCLDACVISEETMEKHHIRLKWIYAKKIYSRTDDYIEFTCEYGYRKVSPDSAFRALCLEGKVAYPTCA